MSERLFVLPGETPDAPRRWLFAFTHPDDEISICAWMRRLICAGAEVYAGWSVTNQTRQNEAIRAMASIGLGEERLFFHEMPDQGACNHLEELISKWKNAIQVAKPDRIAVGAFECGHIDHDSTNFAIAHAATGTNVSICEIPFYHPYLTRIPVINRFACEDGQSVLSLTPEEWKFKAQFSRRYKSQNIASLLVWYTVLGWAKGKPPALCRTERMRVQSHFNYRMPNLPKEMAERVQASEIWKRWLSAVDRFENETS